jgi:tetratricopeptide (TPR) repeat protein
VSYSLTLLGNIALALGEYEQARDLLRQSITVSKSNDNRLEMGKALRSLGVVTETIGDVAEAKRLYRGALTTLSEVDDTLGTAGALANLAGVAHYEGNNEEARRLYYIMPASICLRRWAFSGGWRGR